MEFIVASVILSGAIFFAVLLHWYLNDNDNREQRAAIRLIAIRLEELGTHISNLSAQRENNQQNPSN